MPEIEEAKVITETKPTNNLLERAKQQSTFKHPGENLNGSATTNSTNTESASKKVAKKWLFNDSDFKKQDITDNLDGDDETDEIKKKENGEQVEIVSEADRKASAETMTGLLDLGLSTGFGLWELNSYKKSFTKTEWKRVKEIRNAKRADLSEDDKLFYDKVKRRTEKYIERKNEIEMDPDEIRKTEKGFFQYYTAANKKVDPNFLFYSTLLIAIGGRFTDKLMDEGYE
jgi:hypothetical protein